MTPVVFEEMSSQELQHSDTILLFSLTECPPCTLIKGALEAVLAQNTDHTYAVFECRVDPNDKKGLGKLFLSGINSFPSLQVRQSGNLVGDYSGVPEDWKAADACNFLKEVLFSQARDTQN